jgi:hypothetical protein
MFGITFANLPSGHVKRKVLKDLLIYEGFMLCRAYGHAHEPLSLTIMYRSNPKFFHFASPLSRTGEGGPTMRPPLERLHIFPVNRKTLQLALQAQSKA